MRAKSEVTGKAVVQMLPAEVAGHWRVMGEVIELLCVSHKHKLAELHPGNVLKIRDRRCKITVVFDLGSCR